MRAWKVLQRQFYDILSNKCYIFLLILLIYTSLISFIHFCEVWINGTGASRLKGNNWSNSFLDNLKEKNVQDKLCQYSPIDAVYTWVNGSDPIFNQKVKFYEKQLRKETASMCSFSDCLPSHFTSIKMNVSDLHEVLDQMSYISSKSIKLDTDCKWTILRWDSIKTAEEEAYKPLKIKEQSLLSFHVYWTTDESAPNLYFPSNTIAIKGIDKSLISLSKQMLDHLLGQETSSIWRFTQIIFAELQSQSDVLRLLKGKKWNVLFAKHAMKLNITRAGLILQLPSKNQPEDFAASRFEDKEELRYSLRSLEKFAPWIRKVFIVTNGQLPHWLDLSNPRLQIVTHESIFTNLSHLPTFSSPAIETHIHRIPGLSEKFLYFNDDIFLGEEVYPEDFYTLRGGQKVYLSWPVPDCSGVCPWTWVGDGTCDIPCNTSVCDFDGGDCLSSESTGSNQLHFHEEDYQDDPVIFPAKLSPSVRSHDYYKISTEKIDGKNNSFVINRDDDLNELLGFLDQNRTAFAPNVVKDMFLLLQKFHLNGSMTQQIKQKLKEQQSIKTEKSAFNSLVFKKLKYNYKPLVTIDKKNNLSFPKRVKRTALQADTVNEEVSRFIKLFEQTTNKYSGLSSKTARMILSMNLSRTQVGVPPIGVAENFYAFQHELASLQRKLDTFAESMLYVNSLLNKRYGYKARKVPSHMPHLIDKSIMDSLQNVFSEQYNITSSHYFRHPQDMQFSFSYFYYLMSEEVDVPISRIFDIFDTDESGTWSDRELRTVLTRLYELPLQRSSVLSLETALLYCARDHQYNQQLFPPPYERYIDSKLPLITKSLVENCTILADLLKRKMGKTSRYKYTLMKVATRESTVGFYMITSNMTHLLTALDKIRSRPKKFICLNDNLDPVKEEDNQLIREILVDFFHSMFPKPSKFELPADYRNRYLYYSDFVLWQSNKKRLSIVMYTTLAVTIGFIFYCLFHKECNIPRLKAKKKLLKPKPWVQPITEKKMLID